MKKELLLLTASLVAIGSAMPAFGADLATRSVYTKAPPLVAAAYDWSGFYVGINGGWGTSRNCWNFSGTDEGCHDSNGGTVGGQIGYRWQMGQLVLGVEGQGNWADFSGSNVSLAFAPAVNQSKINAFGLMTGQVGYAWNNVLLYAKGGAAVTNTSYTSFVSSGVRCSQTPTTIRAGAAWSARASSTALRRTGRPVSNTTTCSCRIVR